MAMNELPKSVVKYDDVPKRKATLVRIASDTRQHCQDEIQRCLFIAECSGTWATFSNPVYCDGRWRSHGAIGYVLTLKHNGE